MSVFARKTTPLTAQLASTQDKLLQEKAKQSNAQQQHIAAAAAALDAATVAAAKAAAVDQALGILEAAGVDD